MDWRETETRCLGSMEWGIVVTEAGKWTYLASSGVPSQDLERGRGLIRAPGSCRSECHLLLQVLLPAASLLQLMDVRQNCCDFLQSQLHPTNCLGIRAFADVHTCTDLLQQANAYAGNGGLGGGGAGLLHISKFVQLTTWSAVDSTKIRSALCCAAVII